MSYVPGVSCCNCGHSAIITAAMQEKMDRCASPIYKMRCTVCGERDAVYKPFDPKHPYIGREEREFMEQNDDRS